MFSLQNFVKQFTKRKENPTTKSSHLINDNIYADNDLHLSRTTCVILSGDLGSVSGDLDSVVRPDGGTPPVITAGGGRRSTLMDLGEGLRRLTPFHPQPVSWCHTSYSKLARVRALHVMGTL